MIDNMIILGIILSIIFYEITEISPGGVIVPAYFALYINNPQKIILTLVSGIIIFFIVKFISNYTIIYGRRKFALYIMVSFFIRIIIKYLNIYFVNEYEVYLLAGSLIGIIIPGLLAQNIDRYGITKTVCSLMMLAIFIKAVMEIVSQTGGII